MEHIIEMRFSKMRNNEHFQFITDVDAMITTATPAVLNIESIYPEFQTALANLNNVLQVDAGSIRTDQLTALDTLRDTTWSALTARIRATLICPIEKEVASARILKRIFDLYGKVRKMSYNEETAALTNLIEDLEKEENVPHVNTVGIGKWVNELKKQNTEFQEVLNARNVELANKESGDVNAARLVIDPVYEKMVNRLNAMVTLEMASAEAQNFIKELNQRIKYYESTISARTGRKDKVDEEEPVTAVEEN